MRILVDYTLANEICQILEILGYEATYVGDLGIESLSDEATLEIARDYDCLLTASAFRDPAEWLAVHQALIEHGLTIVQVRLPKTIVDPAVDALRCLIPRLEEWTIAVQEDYSLIIISNGGMKIRSSTKDDVADIIRQRSDVDKAYDV